MSDFVVEVSDQDFEAHVLKSDKPTLVDFWAEWCAPCRTLSPVVEEVAKLYADRVKVGKMNIDIHPNTPGKYNVRAIPTLLLFKEGQMVDQLVGLVGKEKLGEFLDRHL